MMDRGTYVEHDGRPAVRFTRRYPHPAERVWAAVSEPAGLRHWFPSQVELEPRVGGRIAFRDDPNMPEETSGTVLAYDPPRVLAFTWGGDELHLTVEPDGDGAVFTLLNVLEARDTAARNAAGWTVCLTELEKHLRGARADGPHSAAAAPWQELYAAYVAAGVPSGAPIPG
jgi:uncharacterized protein YndB with AHSA1/START domain